MIRLQMFRGRPNHMPPETSNNGGHLPNHDYATVDKKGFNMAPLPSSYRIGAILLLLLLERPP